MERAKHHNFTKKGSVRFYLELTVLLGSGFATDPQYPWAAELLRPPGIFGELERADALHEAYLEYADAVIGAEATYLSHALHRVQLVELESLPRTGPRFPSAMLSKLLEVYPEKTSFVHPAALQELWASSATIADASDLPALHGLCGFFFGHSFWEDDFLPWRQVTAPPKGATVPVQVERLRAGWQKILQCLVP